MFKSVFAKYLTAICVLILACILILAWINNSVVRNYAAELKRKEMNWSCSTGLRPPAGRTHACPAELSRQMRRISWVRPAIRIAKS